MKFKSKSTAIPHTTKFWGDMPDDWNNHEDEDDGNQNDGC